MTNERHDRLLEELEESSLAAPRRTGGATAPPGPVAPRGQSQKTGARPVKRCGKRAIRADDSQAPIERLLRVPEVAAMLGVQDSTVYQWAYQRRLPVVKVCGRSLRFRLRDILRVIDDGYQPARLPLSELG